MEEACCTEGMIQSARNQYHNSPQDGKGMMIGTTYNTFDGWVAQIRENGADFMNDVFAAQFGVDPDALTPSADAAAFVPSVQPEIPFSQMTLEEMRAYTDSLPDDERAAFLANLTPEERRSILRQLPTEQQADIAADMAEFGNSIGLNVTVDSADEEGVKLSVRNAEGKLIDSTSLGLTVDPTGWDTTIPVLGGAGMMLTACGGLYLISRKQKEEYDG